MVLLQDKIKSSGMTLVFIAEKIGMSRETLYNKLGEKSEFKASEIKGISNVLRLTKEDIDAIFF